MQENIFEITDDLLASKSQRFVHYIVDAIPQYLFFYILTYLFYYLGEFTGIYVFYDYWNGISEIEDLIITYLFIVLYYFVMEKYTFKTFGKLFTKTIVVSIDGSEPTSKQILQRSLSRCIPFDAFSFLGTIGKGWHDSLSNTCVVKEDKFYARKNALLALEKIGQIGNDY
ncbi:RDD family protein [Winogradskyella psychrotolerans]|uniref:RDD family protein n=1 Tax=Winogradskyella psychrotolerans TaxID=1344585 RepID=UPI001C06CBDB|nr:RDD family protein [Winogradskyella psychrotolerans]MBU2927935.1 RDD family protein [Winogradskyella psychrotolerans]